MPPTEGSPLVGVFFEGRAAGQGGSDARTGSLRRKAIIAGVALLLIGGAIGFALYDLLPWRAYFDASLRLFEDRAAMAAYIKSWGILAPLAFMFVQAFQVVASPIPGEVTGLLGGIVFGTAIGFLYSTIGLTIGSIACFAIARWLEVRFVERFVPKEISAKFDFLTRAEGIIVTFVMFVIPGFPKDYLCYLLGLSHMPWRTFLLVSTIGRMPGTWLLSVQGSNIWHGNYWEFGAVLVATVLVVYLAHRYKNRIHAWAHRAHVAKEAAAVPAEGRREDRGS